MLSSSSKAFLSSHPRRCDEWFTDIHVVDPQWFEDCPELFEGDDILDRCKQHPNKKFKLPASIKKRIRSNAVQSGYYSQIVRIRRKVIQEDEDLVQFEFEGQTMLVQEWFSLEHDWLTTNFKYREPKFYESFV